MDDRQFSDEQAASLVGGGDCEHHYHTADRQITHDSILQFQDNERIREISAAYTATYDDDYLFVNTTSGAVSITLPIARGGKDYTIVRVAGTNAVSLTPNGTDKINGAATLSLTSSYAPVRIKALKGTGWIQV